MLSCIPSTNIVGLMPRALGFSSPPTYSKDLELPLPFADAIQNFGVFETRSMLSNYFMIPVYPEGAKYEGRSSEDWHYSKYGSSLHLLKECGIPLNSVDTCIKDGSAWWTYKIREVYDSFDFQCIIPFLHHTDHSAILSSMFLLVDGNTKSLLPIIKHHTDDQDYGVRLREVPSGFPFQSFSALCHASRELWEFPC
ncbi:coat protein [Thalictrum thalictroides]|uniref:Coat protein n=1 Tax=Thalictrum thalictroides TaxID=46969 RepID=A0A7J6VE69_THATH|nr:coat protein [Thalictrum thalictroides]